MRKLLSCFVLLLALSEMSCTIRPVVVRRADHVQLHDPLTRPVIDMELVIYNPNRLGVTLDGLTATVALGGATLAEVKTGCCVQVPAAGEVPVPLRVEPALQDLPGLLTGSLTGAGECRGTVTVRKFIFRKTYPFRTGFRL